MEKVFSWIRLSQNNLRPLRVRAAPTHTIKMCRTGRPRHLLNIMADKIITNIIPVRWTGPNSESTIIKVGVFTFFFRLVMVLVMDCGRGCGIREWCTSVRAYTILYSKNSNGRHILWFYRIHTYSLWMFECQRWELVLVCTPTASLNLRWVKLCPGVAATKFILVEKKMDVALLSWLMGINTKRSVLWPCLVDAVPGLVGWLAENEMCFISDCYLAGAWCVLGGGDTKLEWRRMKVFYICTRDPTKFLNKFIQTVVGIKKLAKMVQINEFVVLLFGLFAIWMANALTKLLDPVSDLISLIFFQRERCQPWIGE